MNQLTLESSTLHEFELELVKPLTTSRGTLSVRSVVILEATFSIDGTTVVGVGESAPMPGWGTESYEASRRALENLTNGALVSLDGDCETLAALEDTPTARCALETAALDAISKARGIPLASYLVDEGAAAADVLLNATLGITVPEDAARQARDAVDAGFRCLKMKVGSRDLEDDLKAVSHVRDGVADTISLRLDANGAWTEQFAVGALDAFEPHSIEYVEQPVPADDLGALERLHDNSNVAIAADESVTSPERARALIDGEIVDVLILKPMALGGVLPALELADRAHAAGLGVTLTSFVDSAVGRSAVAHAAASRAWLRGPHGIATGAWLASDVARDPDPIRDGAYRLERIPGLGREFVLS